MKISVVTERRKRKMKKFKRLLAVVLSFVITMGVLFVTDSPGVMEMVDAATNPYSGGYSNCTWTAWQLTYDRLGIALPGFTGNAIGWYQGAINAGYQVDGNPSVNSICVWENGSYGHVAFVTQVNGNQIYVLEGGYGQPAGYHEGWAPSSGYRFPNQTSTYPDKVKGYIHLTASNTDPRGCVDSAVSNDYGKITVAGWAFDPDTPSKSIDVHVYVGAPAGGSGYECTVIKANQKRDDVNKAYGISGKHGFNATISTNKKGKQKVYVYAINSKSGNNPQISCKTVSIKTDTTPPSGSNMKYTVNDDGTGYTVSIKVTDSETGVDRVQFPTWTSYKNQDDIQKNWATNSTAKGKQNGNVWTFEVKDSDHNYETGEYNTHIYAYDKSGNSKCIGEIKVTLEHKYKMIATATYDGHTYQLYNDSLIWSNAKAKCEELGGHLATITSAEEQKAVAGMLSKGRREGYWIGGSGSGTNWSWLTGEAFSYSNWHKGEPNGAASGEDSIGIYKSDGTWNDWTGKKTLSNGFILEIDPKVETVEENTSTADSDFVGETQNNSSSNSSTKTDSNASDNSAAADDDDEDDSDIEDDDDDVLDGVDIRSIVRGKGFLKVKWTKPDSDASGIQIQYSTSSKFKATKTKTIKSNTKTSIKLKKLKRKKTYYVRVRAYKTVNGVKDYSAWSMTFKRKVL